MVWAYKSERGRGICKLPVNVSTAKGTSVGEDTDGTTLDDTVDTGLPAGRGPKWVAARTGSDYPGHSVTWEDSEIRRRYTPVGVGNRRHCNYKNFSCRNH